MPYTEHVRTSDMCALAIQICTYQFGAVKYWNQSFPENCMTWWESKNAWTSDCLGFVRACVCGWQPNKNLPCGGINYQNYASFYNANETGIWNTLIDQSYDFTSIVPGEMLYRSDHVALYVGDFQWNGHTYNYCESTGWDWIGRCSYIDNTGLRWNWKDGTETRGRFTGHGKFNSLGTMYPIVDYDGGSIGATGFGTALTEDEVNYYWDTMPELTYSYVEAIAYSVHGMPSDVFAVMAGWGWGEAYSREYPIGWNKPDYYLAYLCDCCPVNYYEGYNITTAQGMADQIRGGATGTYYSLQALTNRAHELEANETSNAGQDELKALLLALLNPNQEAVFCAGPWSGVTIIYQNTYAGEGVIASFYQGTYASYDTTGTGIRGGLPDPTSKVTSFMKKMCMYLRPWQHYSQYRNLITVGRRIRI